MSETEKNITNTAEDTEVKNQETPESVTKKEEVEAKEAPAEEVVEVKAKAEA